MTTYRTTIVASPALVAAATQHATTEVPAIAYAVSAVQSRLTAAGYSVTTTSGHGSFVLSFEVESTDPTTPTDLVAILSTDSRAVRVFEMVPGVLASGVNYAEGVVVADWADLA